MTETEQADEGAPRSRRNLVLGGLGALVAAAAIIVVFVLPAEYGIDPTGAGEAMGLTEIAEPPANPYLAKGMKREGVLVTSETPPSAEPGNTDHWEFELEPFGGIEFKYVIPEGERIAFFWSATGPLNYDMHGHPFDGGPELTESYSIEEAARLGGHYVAPFTGIHGWHWQNRSMEPVTLTLDASGGMTGSKIFDKFGEHDRALTGGGQPTQITKER